MRESVPLALGLGRRESIGAGKQRWTLEYLQYTKQMQEVILSGQVKSVTEVVTGCLRPTKVAIFAV